MNLLQTQLFNFIPHKYVINKLSFTNFGDYYSRAQMNNVKNLCYKHFKCIPDPDLIERLDPDPSFLPLDSSFVPPI